MKTLISSILAIGLFSSVSMAQTPAGPAVVAPDPVALARQMTGPDAALLRAQLMIAYITRFELEKAGFIAELTGAAQGGTVYGLAVGGATSAAQAYLTLVSRNALNRGMNSVDAFFVPALRDFTQRFDEIAKQMAELNKRIDFIQKLATVTPADEALAIQSFKELAERKAAMASLLQQRVMLRRNGFVRFIAQPIRLTIAGGAIVILADSGTSALAITTFGKTGIDDLRRALEGFIKENEAIMAAYQARPY